MFHFESDIDAFVLYSYKDKYGSGDMYAEDLDTGEIIKEADDDEPEYCLLLLPKNEKPYTVSWYYQSQLKKIGVASAKELKLLTKKAIRH